MAAMFCLRTLFLLSLVFLAFSTASPVKVTVSKDKIPFKGKDKNLFLLWFLTKLHSNDKLEWDCGIPEVKPVLPGSPPPGYIVGGNAARPGSWPWMISMDHPLVAGHWCGASLIAPKWALTARHCFNTPFDNITQWNLVMGRYETFGPPPPDRAYKIKELHVLDSFRADTYQDDIALLELDRPVKYGPTFSPVCVSQKIKPPAGSPAVVTGWGDTDGTGGDFVLKQARVPLISNKRCNRPDWYGGRVTSRMTCAGYKEGGTDACFGDSGGPLAYEYQGRWYLIGITSWGASGACALPKKPTVYTLVRPYVRWIRSIIDKHGNHHGLSSKEN